MKDNKLKLNEISPSIGTEEDIQYNDVVSVYFLELINILDIRLHSLSKSIRGKEAIVKKIAPKLMEFVSEFTKPQYIKFFKQTFTELNLNVNDSDIKDIIFAIRRFETKRQNIISKKSYQKKDVELINDLLDFIKDIENNQVSTDLIERYYREVYKKNSDYKSDDTLKDKVSKINDEMSTIKTIVNDTLSGMDFKGFYNNDLINSLLDFIESNIDNVRFIPFKNKGLTSILLRMNVNLKSNVILKGLLSDVESEIINLNKKRLLLIFVELFTQLYFPNSLKTGMTLIEKVLLENFTVSGGDNISSEMPQSQEVSSVQQEVSVQQQINIDKDEEIKSSMKDYVGMSKTAFVSDVQDMYLNGVKLLSTESQGVVEFYIPSNKKFQNFHATSVLLMKDANGEYVKSTKDGIQRFENNELPMNEENYIIYLNSKGKTSDNFFRYTIDKSYFPSETNNGSERLEVFRQLLKLENNTFVELHNKDVDITKPDVILPEFVTLIPVSYLQDVINKFKKD